LPVQNCVYVRKTTTIIVKEIECVYVSNKIIVKENECVYVSKKIIVKEIVFMSAKK